MIFEGTVLSFNLNFRVMFGGFLQTFEGSKKTINMRIVDAFSNGPSDNV